MFKPEIATAEACFFLEQAPSQKLNDLVLMKLMVIAEREVMRLTTALLTGATFTSMQNGPVLSEVLNLMKGTLPSPLWRSCVEFIPYAGEGTESNHCRLKKTLDAAGYFSELELGVLNHVWKKHGNKTKWEIVEITHEFPEWDETCAATKSSTPITLESIFRLSLKEDSDRSRERAEEIEFFESISA